MTNKKLFPCQLLVLLAFVVFSFENCGNATTKHEVVTTNAATTTNVDDTQESSGLNRHPSHIKYSKHAKCRMDCRHITAEEIADILKNGAINYKKSELQGEPCRKKYAVEGYSKDNQHLRIIFAPCGDEETVVTCIDLGVEWACECK